MVPHSPVALQVSFEKQTIHYVLSSARFNPSCTAIWIKNFSKSTSAIKVSSFKIQIITDPAKQKNASHVTPPNQHFLLSAKMNGTQRRMLVSSWRMHCKYCSKPMAPLRLKQPQTVLENWGWFSGDVILRAMRTPLSSLLWTTIVVHDYCLKVKYPLCFFISYVQLIQIKIYSKSTSVIKVDSMKNMVISITNRKPSRATIKSTLFTVNKDEWDTKEDTGKSMKNIFYVLQYTKRHLLSWSDIEQWKNQARSLSWYRVTLVWKASGCTKSH